MLRAWYLAACVADRLVLALAAIARYRQGGRP